MADTAVWGNVEVGTDASGEVLAYRPGAPRGGGCQRDIGMVGYTKHQLWQWYFNWHDRGMGSLSCPLSDG